MSVASRRSSSSVSTRRALRRMAGASSRSSSSVALHQLLAEAAERRDRRPQLVADHVDEPASGQVEGLERGLDVVLTLRGRHRRNHRRRVRIRGARHPAGPSPPYPRHRGRRRTSRGVVPAGGPAGRAPRAARDARPRRGRRAVGRQGADRAGGAAPPDHHQRPAPASPGLLPATGRFRIYTVTGTLPKRSDAEYRLTVDGSVDRPAVLDLADLRDRLPQTSLTRDFQCVTGWRVADVPWQGVKLADLLDEVGVRPSATHVRFWSFDGVYTETLTIEQARRDDVLIAHHMLGKPVTREHGGPVRLYVAPMYGYKSLKWLERDRGRRRPRRPHRPRLLGAPRLRRRRVGRASRTAATTTPT